MVEMNFNPQDHRPGAAYEPLPKEWYAMRVTATKLEKTSAGTGQYLEIELEIDERYYADPSLHGRKVWDRLNLWNPSQKAVQIAQGQLSALCHAIGWLQPLTNTEILHHKTVAVKVGVRPAKGDYDASNVVKGYDNVTAKFQLGSPVARNVSPPQGQVAAPPPQQASAPQQQPPGTQPMQQPPAQQQPAQQPAQQQMPGTNQPAPPWQS